MKVKNNSLAGNNSLYTKTKMPSRKIGKSNSFLILKNNRYGPNSKYTLKEYYIRYIRSLYYEY